MLSVTGHNRRDESSPSTSIAKCSTGVLPTPDVAICVITSQLLMMADDVRDDGWMTDRQTDSTMTGRYTGHASSAIQSTVLSSVLHYCSFQRVCCRTRWLERRSDFVPCYPVSTLFLCLSINHLILLRTSFISKIYLHNSKYSEHRSISCIKIANMYCKTNRLSSLYNKLTIM